jgi:hypothetical protein
MPSCVGPGGGGLGGCRQGDGHGRGNGGNDDSHTHVVGRPQLGTVCANGRIAGMKVSFYDAVIIGDRPTAVIGLR